MWGQESERRGLPREGPVPRGSVKDVVLEAASASTNRKQTRVSVCGSTQCTRSHGRLLPTPPHPGSPHNTGKGRFWGPVRGWDSAASQLRWPQDIWALLPILQTRQPRLELAQLGCGPQQLC